MEAFLMSLAMVVLAELGDKTQLLAIAFAERYKWQIVMQGVFAATILNHLMAVLVGTYLGSLLDAEFMHFVAAIAFVVLAYGRYEGIRLMKQMKVLYIVHF